MNDRETSLVVFTDLDGSLLDHDDYSWSGASRAIEHLRDLGVPLVLVSSKTRLEMEALRRELRNDHPFVVENGAAVYLPGDWAAGEESVERVDEETARIVLGIDRRDVLRTLAEIRDRRGFRFQGFADWSAAEVAQRTGLEVRAAAAAKQRDATEPLLWMDDRHESEELSLELEERGLRLIAGGRFLHAMGRCDKGTAVRWLIERYERRLGPLTTVAVGDSPNDLGMLRCADFALVLPRVGGSDLTDDQIAGRGATRLIRADLPGSAGWQQAMDELFERLDRDV